MLTWNEVLRLAEQGNHPPDRRVSKTDEQWRALLTPEQYQVARRSGTERQFSHPSCQRFEPGVYCCLCCQTPLFDSRQKFDSGTGWPSFTQPIKFNAISYHADSSHGMIRVEVKCNCCDAHLGHVFPDGPSPAGLRYCINGVAMEKVKDDAMDETKPVPRSSSSFGPVSPLNQVTLGGGCFWCTEALFQQVRGVHRVESGYAGGSTPNPSYEAVCSGNTGHAEVIQITYDPTVVSFQELVTIHLCTHDPTTLNRQGADHGTQYRSIIFFSSPEERATTQQVIDAVTKAIGKPVVTELEPFEVFYPAEIGHQDYYNRNQQRGYCVAVIEPKLDHLRRAFAKLLR
jgi:peptide methionine sulfoxide reductase msrA/msrB